MKIQTHFRSRPFSATTLSVAVFIASFALIAWAGDPKHVLNASELTEDTIPPKNSQKSTSQRDFDKELSQLDEAKKQLEELKNRDWSKIQQDVEDAMKKIDVEKIRLQAQEAITKIDLEKMGKEIEESLRKIDFNKIERDIEAAMDEVSKIDKEKIKQEIQKARKEVDEQLQKKEWRKEMEEAKKINMKEIEKEMENVKEEMSRVKEELKLEKLDMKETMRKAHVEIGRAKEELKGYQEMIYDMEKQGLLDAKEDYTIEYRQGQLTINGKKQSTEVSNKYKKYFKKDSMTIKKQNGDLKIDNNSKF